MSGGSELMSATALIKVGGSLFDLPDLPERLTRLSESLPEDEVLFLAGGGRSADIVREWQTTFSLDDLSSHHLAIDSMRLSARLLATLLASARVLDPVAELAPNHSPLPADVPHDWTCTSDAIAAWLAMRHGCRRLVFAKSVTLGDSLTSDECATLGHLDPLTPGLLDRFAEPDLSVEWVNLRDARLSRTPLHLPTHTSHE